MGVSRRRCRCHSRKFAHRCCDPWLGGRPAPTPLALMRSRYAAYAKGAVDYVIDTTTPGGPQWEPDRETWRSRIEAFSSATRFEDLRVLEAPDPGPEEGFVTFEATLTQNGQDVSFVERSRFVRHEGRWTYHSGEPA